MHFDFDCYNVTSQNLQQVDAWPSQDAAPAKVSRKPSTPAQAAENRGHRERALSKAIPAMRTLFLSDAEPRVPPESIKQCSELYTLARVELAHIRKELGVFDQDRISEISDLFGVNRDAIDFLWFVTASYAEDEHAKRHQAASKKLAADGHAAVAHKRLVDLAEAARVFLKTQSRNDALFAKRAGRAGIQTGMPTVQIEGVTFVVVRGVPDGPGGGRFTTAERKAMATELGVRIDTVRRAERDRTPDDFEEWADRLRKAAATKAAKEAARLARLNRRRRKPGRTVAVREYSRRSGYSLSHSWRLLEGLTTAQIKARTAPPDLTCIGGYGTVTVAASVWDESDKSSVHPAFEDSAKTRDGETVHSRHESNKESDSEGLDPAFFQSFAPDHLTADDLGSALEQNLETSDFLASVAAWKVLRANHDAAVGCYHRDRAARRHEMLERTRASTVYGNHPLRDDAEHDDDLRHLEDGQEDAMAAFLGLDRHSYGCPMAGRVAFRRRGFKGENPADRHHLPAENTKS